MARLGNMLLVFVFGVILCAYTAFCQEPLSNPAADAGCEGSNEWILGALPESSKAIGDWAWSESMLHDGSMSHIQSALGKISRYSFTTGHVAGLDSSSIIEQYIYPDPKNPPAGIMIKLFLSKGPELVLYWEGMEEVFSEFNEYITAWYMGSIPEPGAWTKLSINLNELDISAIELKGIEFILINGRVWWGKTILVNSF